MKTTDYCILIILSLVAPISSYGQSIELAQSSWLTLLVALLAVLIVGLLIFALSLLSKVSRLRRDPQAIEEENQRFENYIQTLNSKQIQAYLNVKKKA